jgi:hypothetical protein
MGRLLSIVADSTNARTAALFAWLNQVKGDNSLPASAFKVAFELGQWINGELFSRDGTLAAWPSLETIGAGIGMSERTARDMVKRLESRRHLSIKTGHGPGHPSRYMMTINRQEPAALKEMETGSGLPDCGDANRQSDVAKPAVQRPETGSRLPTNHLEPFLNHEREGARATLLPSDFRLDDQTYGWALDRLGSNDAVDRSMSRFVDHYRQVIGKHATSRDWQAKARLWIDDDATKAAARSDKSVVGAAKRLEQKLASFDARPQVLTDEHFEVLLTDYAKFGRWTRHVGHFGSEPLSPGCIVPRHLLIKYGHIKESAA